MSGTSERPPVTVIKIGGALVARPEALDPLWQAVPAMQRDGSVVVVHGGGPQATEVARRLGHEPRIVHGRRVTTDADLEIVQWTLRGALNSQLVAQAARHGVAAVGVSGADGGVLQVERRPPWQVDGEEVDFGWVGDVRDVRPALLDTLLGAGYVPVLAPLGVDARGQLYNVNADTVACAVATALRARRFLLVTEAGGVRGPETDGGGLLPACDPVRFAEGLAAGWIGGGMRVKVQVAFDALEAGIPDVVVAAPGDLLQPGRGTRIVPSLDPRT